MNIANIPEATRQWVCLQCGYNMIGDMPIASFADWMPLFEHLVR